VKRVMAGRRLPAKLAAIVRRPSSPMTCLSDVWFLKVSSYPSEPSDPSDLLPMVRAARIA
jgi:hypothetical protein